MIARLTIYSVCWPWVSHPWGFTGLPPIRHRSVRARSGCAWRLAQTGQHGHHGDAGGISQFPGLMVGIPITLMGARIMQNQLYLVKSYDPGSMAVAIFALAGAVAVAGFVPARRAASIDPMRALRNE